jgi:hypothetical protein
VFLGHQTQTVLSKKLLLRQQENMLQSLATKFSPEVVIGLSVLTFSKKNKKKKQIPVLKFR